MTLEIALQQGIKIAGRRDAGLFLAHATGYSTNGIIVNILKEMEAEDHDRYISYLERWQTGEPLQYIIGEWDFMGLTFSTDKRALIPRPETELLVEEAFKFMSILDKSPVRVLDACTGSGCIALSLACGTGGWADITATDISADALALARENAQRLGLPDDRVNFIQSDLLENVTGEFDVIISNPPYILSGDIAGLSPTVRDHEPHLALDGGADGLDFYRRLIPQAKKLLAPDGMLLLEIGPPTVTDIMKSEGFDAEMLQDYAKIDRIVCGVIQP
ncbi:MAG: peptide chain release factor N(5)-glutamine methyltransferase [Defluviitaleaceae bacterium]|nr:peptide chain release factor N(5)-glutamine methyltransferase [Defluviitaleaceae bacterium]